MEQRFRDWMVRRNNMTDNTAYSYANAIKKISENYSEDVFRIRDQETLESLREDYSKTGRFRKFGQKGNGTVRNAIATYCKYFEDVEINAEEVPQDDPLELDEMAIEGSNFSYERDLKNALIVNIPNLFPGYKIFGNNDEGVEYKIEGKYIDLLLEKDNQLQAIELKAGLADYRAFGQLSMYLGLLKNKFPEKIIQGVIIASVIDQSLEYAAITNEDVQLKTYQMGLSLRPSNMDG